VPHVWLMPYRTAWAFIVAAASNIMDSEEKRFSVPCLKPKDDQEAARVIVLNDNHKHKQYKGNYTTTSKYNLLTFFPKALFEQYRWASMQVLV
jgi:hypothetical protein